MKIIYMGTPDFAVSPLTALIGAGHEIVCVLTRADKPKGRGHEMSIPPVKAEALRHGIPVLQPLKMKDPALWEKMKSYGADIAVVAAYGKILPPEILAVPPMGCVNIHASLLPDYRGAAPIQWAILDGKKETGITTMKMDEGLDTGDILKQYRIPIGSTETGGSLFDKLTVLGAEAILDTLQGLENGSIVPKKQGESSTGYASMLTKEMGEISWEKDAAETERKVRAFDPWPGSFTFWNGRQLKIWKCHPADGENQNRAKPGTVLKAEKDIILVQAGSGSILSLDEVQAEGKKRMPTADFLRGCRMKEGDILSGKAELSSH